MKAHHRSKDEEKGDSEEIRRQERPPKDTDGN